MKTIFYSVNENLKILSDHELLTQTELLAEESRKSTLMLLCHLREIEIRRLFVDLGFTSMHSYCVTHLKFSEGEAHRRLSSARLLTELPEIEAKIKSGSLNVTNLSKIQSFFRTEKNACTSLTKEQKLEIIENLENLSTREVEKELITKSHKPAIMAEKFHISAAVVSQLASSGSLGGTQEELQKAMHYQSFEALLDLKHQELLLEFKNLYAHEFTDFSNTAILGFMLSKLVDQKKKKLGLIKKAPQVKKSAPSKKAALGKKELPAKKMPASENGHAITCAGTLQPSAPEVRHAENGTSTGEVRSGGTQEKSIELQENKIKPLREHTPVSEKRALWQRAQGCCEYVDPVTKKRCNSEFAIQEDHIEPLALGGSNEFSNKQLLCRNHNSRRAVKTFGPGFIR